MRSSSFLIACICFANIAFSSHSWSEPVTVVELFTSQGCYSCPPADDLLGKLKKQDNTIALACHVTYWNYLGWRDTFSRSFCDKRQRQYQAYIKGRAGVYTPQMVINGQYATVGSRTNSVKRIIEKAKVHGPATITIAQTSQDHIDIDLPSLKTAQTQQLFLLGTAGDHRLPIKRGENGGKTLDYHNPVVAVIDLGRWNGEALSLSKNIEKQPAVREWVVIAQQQPLGDIVAAGKLTLH